MSKRVFWVVFLVLGAPLAALGIMASPVGYLGALVYTKVRNAVAEVTLDVTVQTRLDGKSAEIRRVIRCEGASTAADDGAKFRFVARPGWLVHDLGQGETLVLPVQGLCRAAVKAEWSFPDWSYTIRPQPDFPPLAMIAAADGTVTAFVQASALTAPGNRVSVSSVAVAVADAGAAETAQPPLPAGLAAGEFHFAMLTPVPRDLLAYYPPLAEAARGQAGLVPVEVLPPQMGLATFRFPPQADQLAAWPDAGRIVSPVQQHALPALTGLRRVGERLEMEAVPGVLTLTPASLVGAQGVIAGIEVAVEADTPWRRLLIDAAGNPSVLDLKTVRLPME